MIQRSAGERVFTALNYCLMILFGLSTLLPFFNLVAKSLSDEKSVVSGLVTFWPMGFQIGTYQYVLDQVQFRNSFRVSLIITLLGTGLSMLMTVITAYPLSKSALKGRRFFLLMYVFVMLFSGGIVPSYLLMKTYGLLNTIWVLFLPSMISVYNMLLIKNYFEGLPESIEEAALIDGAGNLRTLFSIVLPMSLPTIATIGLFYAVGYWNSYFNAVVYITKPALKPLQQYLYELITATLQSGSELSNLSGMDLNRQMNLAPDAIRATTIVVSTVPIICLYPFLQRYFVKGIVVGSVKG